MDSAQILLLTAIDQYDDDTTPKPRLIKHQTLYILLHQKRQLYDLALKELNKSFYFQDHDIYKLLICRVLI